MEIPLKKIVGGLIFNNDLDHIYLEFHKNGTIKTLNKKFNDIWQDKFTFYDDGTLKSDSQYDIIGDLKYFTTYYPSGKQEMWIRYKIKNKNHYQQTMLFYENGETKSIINVDKNGKTVLHLNYDKNGNLVIN